jgi:hypothetical protein
MRLAGKVSLLPMSARQWQSVIMDFITQLPRTVGGFDTVMVVADQLSKEVHLVLIYTTVNAPTVAKHYVDAVCKHHGLQMKTCPTETQRSPACSGAR